MRVLEFLRTHVAARTDCPVEQITASSGLIELGLQSIDAVLLCGEVEDEFKIELDPSAIFEHSDLHSFADHIVERIAD
jgi:acyl carrier protein